MRELYIDGISTSGKGIILYGSKIYQDHELVQGYKIFESTMYHDGSRFTGVCLNEVTNNDTRYNNGKPFTGIFENTLYDNGLKYVKPVVYNGNLYREGIFSIGHTIFEDQLYFNEKLFTGEYNVDKLLYINGSLTTGFKTHDGKLYCNSEIYSGVYNDQHYIHGYTSVDAIVVDDVLYVNGSIDIGYRLFTTDDVEKLYHNGLLIRGYSIYQNQLYNDSIMCVDPVIFNNVLFENGEPSSGYSFYKTVLYHNGYLYSGKYEGTSYLNGLIYLGKDMDNSNFIGYRGNGTVLYCKHRTYSGIVVELECIDEGYIGLDGRLYKDGVFYENKTQVLLNNDTELYIEGLLYEGTIYVPKNRAELNAATAEFGINTEWDNDTVTFPITKLPDMRNIYTGYINDSMARLFWGYDSSNDTRSKYPNLTSLDGIEYWDVSNVTSLQELCRLLPELTDILALTNWNVSSVTDLGGMFSDCDSLSDISSLHNWILDSLEVYSNFFHNCQSLPKENVENMIVYWKNNTSNTTVDDITYDSLT